MITKENIEQFIPNWNKPMTREEFLKSIKFKDNGEDFSKVLDELCKDLVISDELKQLISKRWGC